MRFFILIAILHSISEAFGQFELIPPSGMYENEVIVKPDSESKLYYTANDYSIEEMKRIKDSLILSNDISLILRIKSNEVDTIIHRSYHFNYSSDLPILSLTIFSEDLWNDSIGIYVRGKNAIYNDSSGHWENCNYQKKWEKEVFATFIDTNNVVGFSQKSGIKLFGESTRRQPDKSMKLIARSEYGTKRFAYPIFPQKDIQEYKQIAIRTSGNDYRGSRFKDVLSSYLARNLGIDFMAWRPTRLYVNGEYWGVYNLREKVNEHYIASNYNIDKDSVNIIMGRWIRQQGSASQYMKMYHWFEDLDTMDTKAYAKAKQYLDIRNYINYRVFQIYINNKDSRGNIRYFNITGEQEKFKMILYDTDLGYGKYSMNFIEKCLSRERTDWYNPQWSTMYLTKLMQDPNFKKDFTIQFAHIMNTALHRDTMINAVEHFQAIYKDELPRTSEGRPKHLKKTYFPMEQWLDDVNSLKSYAKLRPKVMWNHLEEALNLKQTYILSINTDSGKVNINDNYPIDLPFDGKYFSDYDFDIKAVAPDGMEFSHWSDNDSNFIKTVSYEGEDTIRILPIFIDIIFSDTTQIINTSSAPQNELIKAPKNKSEPVWLWIICYCSLGISTTLFVIYFLSRKKA